MVEGTSVHVVGSEALWREPDLREPGFILGEDERSIRFGAVAVVHVIGIEGFRILQSG